MDTQLFIIGALSGMLSVALGAFGTHAMRGRVAPQVLNTFETGLRYEIYHAFAILAVALAMTHWSSALLVYAGWAFVAGTILFSGSLYLLVFTGRRAFGAVTPFGGIAFIAGWLLLALGVWQSG